MKRRAFVITSISLGVLTISLWRLETVRSQDVSSASTNAIVASSANLDSNGDASDLSAEIVAWLPLDDGHGAQALDASGHGHDGTLVGNPLPVWILGVSSNALQFDGIQNEVKVADDPSLTPTNALTVAAWVKASSTTTGLILDKWSTDGSPGSYSLSLTNGRVGSEFSLNGEYFALIGTETLPDTGWHYVASSYDGTQIVVYLDGSANASTAASGTVDVAEVPLRIGELTGSLDDMRLYSRALNSNEVAALYDAGRIDLKDRDNHQAAANNRGVLQPTSPVHQGPTALTKPLAITLPANSRREHKTLYVDGRNGNNVHDGLTRAPSSGHGPKKDIQAAISAANDHDVVEIAGGTYSNTTFKPSGEIIIIRPAGMVIIR